MSKEGRESRGPAIIKESEMKQESRDSAII